MESLAAARLAIEARLAADDAVSARGLAEQVLRQFPGDYRLGVLLARAHLALGCPSQAAPLLRQATSVDPEDGQLQRLWADVDPAEGRAWPDLPPLASADASRPPISPIALGHLYLRQHLYAHAATQLDTQWREHPNRLDVGAALAEAYWRQGDTEMSSAVCRAVLAATSACIKANLILGQRLFAAGRLADAQPYLEAAQAADPENRVAETLFEWLAVRDPTLVPLTSREVQVDLHPAPAVPAAPPDVRPPPAAELPRTIEATPAEDSGAAGRWQAAWDAAAGRLGLGGVHYGLVETTAASIHVLAAGHHTTMAVTPRHAVAGLVRLQLKRSGEPTGKTGENIRPENT
ncbi:MAG: tetratricopeptide repeat protein [Chloroflexota bacterium]